MTFIKNRSISLKTKVIITVLSTGLFGGCSLSFDQMLPALTGTDSTEVVSPTNNPVKTKPTQTAPAEVKQTIKSSN